MRKVNILLLASILCNGCVTKPSKYRAVYNYHPQITIISEPPLDTVVIVLVGDNMLGQIQNLEFDAIYLSNRVDIGGFTFSSGYYLKTGEDIRSEFYYPANGPRAGKVIYVTDEGETYSSDDFQVIRIDKNNGDFCLITTDNIITSTKKADYRKKKYPFTSHSSFEQTLTYKGTIDDKINIEYRKFYQDPERPVFNHEELEYDLSETNIIVYKTARIEVIAATNEYIKYKVIQNFKNVKNQKSLRGIPKVIDEKGKTN